MRVTNRSKASLGFPCGAVVHPGETVDVSDDHLNHPVVAAWVDEGKIEIEPSAEAPKKGKRDADKAD